MNKKLKNSNFRNIDNWLYYIQIVRKKKKNQNN